MSMWSGPDGRNMLCLENKLWEQIAYPKVWGNKQTIMIEMKTHGQKVQNKGANGEESGDKETQAMILVMVVDQNGKDFAKLKS